MGRVAVIQMVSQAELSANLGRARALLEQAAREGARLAVLPENFAAMGRRDLVALGRAEGERWLRAHAADVGLRPTINLADIP